MVECDFCREERNKKETHKLNLTNDEEVILCYRCVKNPYIIQDIDESYKNEKN